LRTRKVTLEKDAEEAVFHRLEPTEPVAYAALEIQLVDELVLAGVHITKQTESNSITLDPFTIRRWPNQASVQDFFRIIDGDRERTCSMIELKQRAGEWGLDFHAPPTLIAYFRELFDWGVLPLTMATDLERSQYAHLLETSMAGGLSAPLVDRLKNYLLPEYGKLPEATRLMYDNLLACIRTQDELELSNEHYTRIGSLFQNLKNYVAALGRRIRGDTDSANAKLKLTELNLSTTKTQLENLHKTKERLSAKRKKHDAEKQAALSDLRLFIQAKQKEEQDQVATVGKLNVSRQALADEVRPLGVSRDELKHAISGLIEIFPDSPSDCTGKATEDLITAKIDQILAEMQELTRHLQGSEKELTELQTLQGVSQELINLAERIGGMPVLSRYADVIDLNKAARMEAQLGPLVRGLIVKDADKAVQKIAKLDSPLREIWLTTSKDPANEIISEDHGHFQKINCGIACRITRIPERPVLGEAARKKRVQELELQIRNASAGTAELDAVGKKLDALKRHTHRISDEHQERSLSSLESKVASLQTEISQIDLQIVELSEQANKAREEASLATGKIEGIIGRFNEPEKAINDAERQNDIAIAIREPLMKKLEQQRVEGITTHMRLKSTWDSISALPEINVPNNGEVPDPSVALERLRTFLEQLDGQQKVANEIPQSIPEDMSIAASEMLHIRSTVRSVIQAIQPHNLTESSQPEAVIQALKEKISTLSTRFTEQQNVFRNNIDTIADAINSEINKRAQKVLRWSNDLENVQFGTVKGIRLRLDRVREQLQILDDLRQQRELFSQSQTDPKTALQEFWKQRTGQQLTTESALDYRRFVNLVIEVGDGRGKWRPVGGSTGEMTGAALSVLIILLRAWEEQATTLRERVEPLRLLFMDEAGRLDPISQANMEALSTSQSIQLIVAAPTVASSGKFTHYAMARKDVGNHREVYVRGRRGFCEPENINSIT